MSDAAQVIQEPRVEIRQSSVLDCHEILLTVAHIHADSNQNYKTALVVRVPEEMMDRMHRGSEPRVFVLRDPGV